MHLNPWGESSHELPTYLELIVPSPYNRRDLPQFFWLGWRNRQTQRTQNPPGAIPWGFDSPSEHQHLSHFKKKLLRNFPLICHPLVTLAAK